MKKLVAILIFAASLAQAQTPQLPYQMFRDWQAVAGSRAVAASAPVSGFPIWNSPLMTSYVAPSPNTVTSTSINVDYPMWQGIDGNTVNDNRWQTTVSAFWAQLDLGAGNEGAAVTMGITSYLNYAPKTFSLAGSSDGITFTTNLIVPSNSNTVKAECQIFSVTTPALYRFYRMNVTESWNGLSLIEDWWFTSGRIVNNVKMTGSNSPVPFVATASSSFGAAYEAWRAFDSIDNVDQMWYSANNSSPQWVQLDFGSNVLCNGFSIVTRNFPTAFSWTGSTDDTNWTTIQTGSLVRVELRQDYTNSNTTAYRYHRMTLTYNDGRGIKELFFKYY